MPFQFSNHELADIHFVYGFANGNGALAAREYRRRYPQRRHPHPSIFVQVHNRFVNNGLQKVRRDQIDNIQQRRINRNVLQEFTRDPSTSTRRSSVVLGISQSKIVRILKRNHLHSYHLQPVQGLHPGDEQRRVNFCRWILDRLENNRNFLSHVLWTDESCFTRRGIVNFKNQHIWAEHNPRAIRPRTFQNEFSVNVWVGIFENHLLGPYFLPERVNSQNFLEFLETEHANMWEDVPLNLRQHAWFQLDGCPAHFGRNVRTWLDANYPEKWIGRGGPIAWPPRSPDITPLDFFVWGFLKEKVYATPLQDIEDLKRRIRHACQEIRVHHLVAARRSIEKRCRLCIHQNGLHFENLL